jgi:hypothetical protein
LPDCRLKAGKALDRQIQEIKTRFPDEPFPDRAYISGAIAYPGLETHQGVHWLVWNCTFEEVEKGKYRDGRPAIDPTIWERARMSDYWLAREADEAIAAEGAHS